MSKISAKTRYTQLKEWLPTLKSYRDKNMKKDTPQRGKTFSKSDHYKKVNNRYGSKETN
jgi:hypothetical protein